MKVITIVLSKNHFRNKKGLCGQKYHYSEKKMEAIGAVVCIVGCFLWSSRLADKNLIVYENVYENFMIV